MPLNVALLRTKLEQVAKEPPASVAGCAQAWADAMRAYAGGIVPPSATVDAAAAALATALTAAFSAPAAAPGMEAAFAAFAGIVGGGMAGFVPTPPTRPVGFALQFALPPPETHGHAAGSLAARIDTWMRTGLATMSAPPNTPLPWS